MSQTTSQIGMGHYTGFGHGGRGDHTEGTVARMIEEQTAKLPSDLFLWAAGASIVGSLALKFSGRDHQSLFVGQWAPTLPDPWPVQQDRQGRGLGRLSKLRCASTRMRDREQRRGRRHKLSAFVLPDGPSAGLFTNPEIEHAYHRTRSEYEEAGGDDPRDQDRHADDARARTAVAQPAHGHAGRGIRRHALVLHPGRISEDRARSASILRSTSATSRPTTIATCRSRAGPA